jgi:hypothetical protein
VDSARFGEFHERGTVEGAGPERAACERGERTGMMAH